MQKFKNMDELLGYLNSLEMRVETLEKENLRLKSKTQTPKTNVVNPNFLKRAFAIWGHFFVANSIFSIIGAIFYFCVIVLIIQNTLGGVVTPNPETIPTPLFPIPAP